MKNFLKGLATAKQNIKNTWNEVSAELDSENLIKSVVFYKRNKIKNQKIDEMLNQSITKSAHEFLNHYNWLASRRDGSIKSMDSPGIYVV